MYNLNKMHKDVLKEIGNIGVGNALKALSELIHKDFDMNVPVVKEVEFKDIATSIGGAENVIVGILANISGHIEGTMMFVLKLNDAKIILEAFLDNESSECFTEYEMSALKEIGNILVSSYLNSLAALMNRSLYPSVPFLSIDMANAILSVPAIQFGRISDKALFIETLFSSSENNVSGYFILAPSVDSYDIIINTLGMQ